MFVLNPASQILLLHHRKLDKWLQPGGHLEGTDATPLRAAIREVHEECLINVDGGVFLDVDIHRIPMRRDIPAHLHFDLRFLCQVEDCEVTLSRESLSYRWVSLDQVEITFDPGMARVISKIRQFS